MSMSSTAVHGTDFSHQSLSSLTDLPPLSPAIAAGTRKTAVNTSSKSLKEIDKLKELLIGNYIIIYSYLICFNDTIVQRGIKVDIFDADTSLSDPKGDSSLSSAITDDEKQQFENMNDWSECDSSVKTDSKFT